MEGKMRKRLFMILGMVCLFLFISSVVRAEKLSVPPCGFIAQGHSGGQLHLSGDGSYIYRKDTIESYFYTPVYLPHGKIIKWVRFHVSDNDPSSEMRCILLRGNKYNGTANVIYDVYTSGSSSSVRQFTDASAFNPAHTLVNNDVCTYSVAISFSGSSGSDKRVHGITIYYE